MQNAGTITQVAPVTIEKFTISGGTLAGGAQTLTLNGGLIFNNGTINATVNAGGASTWSTGIIASSGTLNILGTAALTGTGTKTAADGGRLNIGDGIGANDTLGTWSGGNINLANTGAMTIKTDATLDNNFDGTITSSVNGGTFNNQGSFIPV